MDWVPVLSQLKSLAQVTFGDAEGAKKTQENFTRQCPVISQGTSAVQAIMGDKVAAKETQLEFVQVLSAFVDSIPVVGHIKGGVHYAVKDKEGGDRSMKASSHMTAVMGAGVGGFFVGGPGAAVGLAAAAGMAMDGITTGVEFAVSKEYKPEGILRPLSDPKNPGVWIDAIGGVAMDGVAGYGAGRIANAVKMSTTITGFEHSDLARGVSASKAPKGILPIKAEAKSIHNEDDKVNSNEKDKLRAKSIHNEDAKVNSDEKNKLSPKKRRRKVSEVFDGLRHRITSRTSKEDKSNEKNKADNIPMQTIITDEVDVFQNSESISSQENNTEEEEESQSGFSSGFETDDDLSEESSDDEADSIQHSLVIDIVQDTIRRNSSCGSYPGWRDDFVLFKKTVFEQDLT